MGRGAGQKVKVHEWHSALPGGSAHLDGRIERSKSDSEIGCVGGNAILTRAKHGVPAVLAADRGAA